MMYKLIIFLLLPFYLYSSTLVLYDDRYNKTLSITSFLQVLDRNQVTYIDRTLDTYKQGDLDYFDNVIIFNNKGLFIEALKDDLKGIEKDLIYFGPNVFDYVEASGFGIDLMGYDDGFIINGEKVGRLPLIDIGSSYKAYNGRHHTEFYFHRDRLSYYGLYNPLTLIHFQQVILKLKEYEEFYYYLDPNEEYNEKILNYIFGERLVIKLTKADKNLPSLNTLVDKNIEPYGIKLNNFSTFEEFETFHTYLISEHEYKYHILQKRQLTKGNKISIVLLSILSFVIISFVVMLKKSQKVMKDRYLKGGDKDDYR